MVTLDILVNGGERRIREKRWIIDPPFLIMFVKKMF